MPTCEKGLLTIKSIEAERGQYGENSEEWRLKITVNGETQKCSNNDVTPPDSFECGAQFVVNCNEPIKLEVSGYEDDRFINDQLPSLTQQWKDWVLDKEYISNHKC